MKQLQEQQSPPFLVPFISRPFSYPTLLLAMRFVGFVQKIWISFGLWNVFWATTQAHLRIMTIHMYTYTVPQRQPLCMCVYVCVSCLLVVETVATTTISITSSWTTTTFARQSGNSVVIICTTPCIHLDHKQTLCPLSTPSSPSCAPCCAICSNLKRCLWSRSVCELPLCVCY